MPEHIAGGTIDESEAIQRMVKMAQSYTEGLSQNYYQQYRDLQKKINQENRQSAVLSNVMKDKSDTAKDSINNVR